MKDFFEKYEEKFKRRSTSALIKGYHGFNADFRKIARDELRRRKEHTALGLLGVKRKKRRSSGSIFGIKPMRFF